MLAWLPRAASVWLSGRARVSVGCGGPRVSSSGHDDHMLARLSLDRALKDRTFSAFEGWPDGVDAAETPEFRPNCSGWDKRAATGGR